MFVDVESLVFRRRLLDKVKPTSAKGRVMGDRSRGSFSFVEDDSVSMLLLIGIKSFC